MRPKFLMIVLGLIVSMGLAAYFLSKNNPSEASTIGISIQSLSPSKGSTGTLITLTGTGLNLAGNTVVLGNQVSRVRAIAQDGTSLKFTVPELAPGIYDVKIINQNVSSNMLTFTVTGLEEN